MTSDGNSTSAPSDEQLEELRTRAALLEQKLNDLQCTSDARLIHAEMKVEAVRAGMVDLDGLRLLDLTGMRINSEGEVEEAAEAISRLKKAKPWLFGSLSSSSPLTAPPAQPSRQKHATEMTNAEYAAARAALLRQRT